MDRRGELRGVVFRRRCVEPLELSLSMIPRASPGQLPDDAARVGGNRPGLGDQLAFEGPELSSEIERTPVEVN